MSNPHVPTLAGKLLRNRHESRPLAVGEAATQGHYHGHRLVVSEPSLQRCTLPGCEIDFDLEVRIRTTLWSLSGSLRSVVVLVTAGRVVLLGRISSYYLKQVAQEAVRRVVGEYRFENRLVVM